MIKFFKKTLNLFMFFVAVILVGCGGGGSSSSTPDVMVAGAYNGTIRSNVTNQESEAIVLVISSGEIRLINSLGTQFIGQLNVSGSQISGAGTAFALRSINGQPGTFTFSDGSTVATVTVNGTASGTSLNGTFSGGGDNGTFNLTADPIYNRPSSLNNVAANYGLVFDLETGETDPDVTLSIDNNGTLTGSDSGGSYNGQVSIIDPNFNAYRVSVTYTPFSGIPFTVTGLGLLDDFVEGSNDSALFGVELSNENLAIFAILRKLP